MMENKLIIVYDNWCPNCSRFAKFIEKKDRFNKIFLIKLREKEEIKGLLFTEIDINQSEKEMASYINGKWKYGYESIMRVTKTIPLFYPLYPLFYLLHKLNIGDILYRELAIRRKIIPLHCDENCSIY